MTTQARLDSRMDTHPVDTVRELLHDGALELALETVNSWEARTIMTSSYYPGFESDRAQCYSLLASASAPTDGGNLLLVYAGSLCV